MMLPELLKLYLVVLLLHNVAGSQAAASGAAGRELLDSSTAACSSAFPGCEACAPGLSACSACAPGRTWCAEAGACVQLKNNRNHCGACGNVCPTVENGLQHACSVGKCWLRNCTSGFEVCRRKVAEDVVVGTCINIMGNDNLHCGGCSKRCVNTAKDVRTCVGGVCTVTQCKPGYRDADKDPANALKCVLSFPRPPKPPKPPAPPPPFDSCNVQCKPNGPQSRLLRVLDWSDVPMRGRANKNAPICAQLGVIPDSYCSDLKRYAAFALHQDWELYLAQTWHAKSIDERVLARNTDPSTSGNELCPKPYLQAVLDLQGAANNTFWGNVWVAIPQGFDVSGFSVYFLSKMPGSQHTTVYLPDDFGDGGAGWGRGRYEYITNDLDPQEAVVAVTYTCKPGAAPQLVSLFCWGTQPWTAPVGTGDAWAGTACQNDHPPLRADTAPNIKNIVFSAVPFISTWVTPSSYPFVDTVDYPACPA